MAPMSDLLPLLDMVLEKALFRIKLKNNFKRNLDYIVKDKKKKRISVCGANPSFSNAMLSL